MQNIISDLRTERNIHFVGFETGGERTYLGETKEDENKRREDAEKAARQRKD